MKAPRSFETTGYVNPAIQRPDSQMNTHEKGTIIYLYIIVYLKVHSTMIH
jgi:hypothetical protein